MRLIQIHWLSPEDRLTDDVIKDLAGVDHSFPAADVVKRETSAKSLMPSAKALNLNDEDLQAIADFLLEVAAKAKK